MKFVLSILIISFMIPFALGGLEVPVVPYNTIEPKEGPLYATQPIDDIEKVYSYVFSVNATALEARDPISLIFYSPTAKSGIDIDVKEKNTRETGGVIDFKMIFANLDPDDLFLGPSRFKLINSNGIVYVFLGPNIVINFKDEKFEKIPDKNLYSYSVWVRSSKMVTIDIYGTKDGKNWEWYGKPIKSNYPRWTKIEWVNAPYFQKLEFVLRK